MAQGNNTTEWVGGPVGFGGGGDVINFACTYTYQPGIGGVIPGPQNIDQVPPSYQNQGFSTTATALRVYGGDQAQSGDQMCSSYNTQTQWTYIAGSEDSGSGALYQRGCCIARWLPGDNGGTNAVDFGGGTGSGTDTGAGGTGDEDTTTITCEDLFYGVTPYQENFTGDIVTVDTINGGEAALTNYTFNSDFDLIYDGLSDQPLVDVQPCCTEETIGFPVEWVNTPDPDYLPGLDISNYTLEQQQFILGRCVVTNNECNIDINGVAENTNGFGNNTIPADNALYYQVGFTGQWTPVLEPCCQDYILGGQGYTVSWDPVLGKCFRILDPCPTPSTVTLDTTNLIVLNATRSDCCTPEATGISTVYWDYVTNECKYTPLPPPEDPCPFDSYQIGPYQTTTENLTNENIQQLFGYLDGELVPVSQSCCSLEVTGYEVSWDNNLNICRFGSSNTIDIVLNEEPISLDGCDEIFVSAKIFFTEPDEKCITDSIVVSLLPNNPNISVSQIDVFDSETDGFNNWVNLSAAFSSTGGTFNLKLNISGGIVKCCDYDIRVDDIKVDCYRDQERLFFDTKKCVGFDLARVIDNKRSWVYNPGADDIGSTQDNLIRERGEDGLIQGYGVINRTFAPSDDADIPWRYTDYYVQSNILEPHSKAVIISKEMELTFNMCSECCITYSECPEGYTLVTTTGGTKYCASTTIYCPSGYTLSAGTCYSGITTASTLSQTVTATTGSYCTRIANLLQLEEYKKVFQSFWVRMIEQFVPATTIFVSGEKWCNNDAFICTEFGECDYDFEYVDSEITIIEYDTDPTDTPTPTNTNGGVVDENNEGETPTNGDSSSELSSPNGPIVIDGFNITPVDRDPTGGGGIVTERIILPISPVILEGINERYYNTRIKGGVKEIFQ